MSVNDPASSDRESAGQAGAGQTEASARKNAAFFLGEHESYKQKVGSIDTYATISGAVTEALRGIDRLLDIGNGGVFDYDTGAVGEITGLDLFLDWLPSDMPLPGNVRLVKGSALDIPASLSDFDGVVMVMLIHHLTGHTVDDCLQNVRRAIAEAHRALRPGGRLVIMESCVPPWFYAFERLVYRPAAFVIEKTITHPPTIQYPRGVLLSMLREAGFADATARAIPKGRYVLQYGVKVPSWLTPVQPVLFSATKGA